MAETAGKPSFSVYPNPASSSITVSLPAGITDGQIRLVDMNGRVTGTFSLTGAMDQKIDVSQLSRGVYMLQLLSNETILTEKLILK